MESESDSSSYDCDTDNESIITVVALQSGPPSGGGRVWPADVTSNSSVSSVGQNLDEAVNPFLTLAGKEKMPAALPSDAVAEETGAMTYTVSVEEDGSSDQSSVSALVTVSVVSSAQVYDQASADFSVAHVGGSTFVVCSIPKASRPSITSAVAAAAAADGSLHEDQEEESSELAVSVSIPSAGRDKFVNPEMPGYVGFANLPNQVHRKSVKKGFEFTLLVAGESGLGKSTLVNSLFLTDLYPDRKIPNASERIEKTVTIETSTVEIEERGVKLRLTVVDTPGYGDGINNRDSFKEIIKYIDSQFEKYLQDESGLNRRHIVDNRVHCCFYFINPAGHGLKPLDIAFMKEIDHKVNIVPVIAKADTLTKGEILKMKKRVMEQVQQNGIQVYTLPECDDDEDEEYKEQCKQLKEAAPFAVCGSTQILEVRGKKVRGRMYPWGIVEVENPEHCDFIKLRTVLITHMQDLQEVTQDVHYENFRSERLSKSGVRKAGAPVRASVIEAEHEKLSEKERQLAEKDAELRRMQEMLSKLQQEVQRPPTNGHSNAVNSNGKNGTK